MKCYEFEGKQLLKTYAIPVPEGQVTDNLPEAVAFFEKVQAPCAIKAQVLSGKRGKAGGIKFADNLHDLQTNFTAIKKMDIYGESVEMILLEKKLEIKGEFYLGITIDPGIKGPVLIFSSEGGMDIEEIAEEYPDRILKCAINEDMKLYEFLDIFSEANIDPNLLVQLAGIARKLVKMFYDLDSTTIEINPLIVNGEGQLIAADSKLVIDDSALFRQKQFAGKQETTEHEDELVVRAQATGLSYVPLDDDGYIGSIAGGAGLALATMDTIRYCGGKPANFLDIGGGVSEAKMTEAVKIVGAKDNIKGIIINVFGGINNCAIMARGIKRALEEDKITAQLVVKMRGHSQEEGWQLLEEMNIPVVKHGTTEEAVTELLKILGGGEADGRLG